MSKSNYIFATKEAFGITLEPLGTFNITNDFELDASIELTEETSIELKNATQLERMTITATGGVATIIKRGLTQGDEPVEDVNLRKPWGDGETIYVTQLAFNIVNKETDNSFEGTQTFKDIDFNGTTTGGLKVKHLTTVQRLAITNVANGIIVYDIDLGENYQYIAGAWSAISAGSTQPNASETVAGKVELATQAELDAGTDIGGSGATLVVKPSLMFQATESNRGLVKKATDAELITGTENTKFITVKQLADAIPVTAGTDETYLSVPTSGITSSQNIYVTLASYIVLKGGVYLCTYGVNAPDGGNADGRILVNGVVYSPLTSGSTSIVSGGHSIGVGVGDLIEFQAMTILSNNQAQLHNILVRGNNFSL